jgi:hypothetical protein
MDTTTLLDDLILMCWSNVNISSALSTVDTEDQVIADCLCQVHTFWILLVDKPDYLCVNTLLVRVRDNASFKPHDLVLLVDCAWSIYAHHECWNSFAATDKIILAA